jgi:hypothetical protein
MICCIPKTEPHHNYLRHDNCDVRQASAGNQTARRYWVTRIGEIERSSS